MSFVVKVNPNVVAFKPVQTVGPVTFGEVNGNVAFRTVTLEGEEVVIVVPILYLMIPLVLWIVTVSIWWWASSDLKFTDISKLIGVLNPVWGVTVEALQK